MGSRHEREVASDIMTVFLEHQRRAREAVCTPHPCGNCMAAHVTRAARFVTDGRPVDFVLPAFPGKSPNRAKVLGAVPDMAERLSLDFLTGLCEKVEAIYPPGVRIIICSDGHVFSDVVQIPDEDITRYQGEMQNLIDSIPQLALFGLDGVYPGCSYDEMRLLMMERHGEPLSELQAKVRSGGELLPLYRGMTRFLLEDAERPDYQGSRTALQRQCRDRAYNTMLRSRAWGRLVSERFPDAVRLSIHPQQCGSSKLGINLLEASDSWTTPWHSTAVDIGGRFVLMKRREAEAMGAELVYESGRPSHFVAAAPRVAPSDLPELVSAT